ncbi:MAG: ABC transporter permease [Candidatus Zixiibacteriota bacterium]
MFKHYLITAIRSALHHKLYSFINLLGMVIGLSSGILIYLWVVDELGVNKFHENGDNLYRIEQTQFGSGRAFHVNITSHPLGEAIQNEFSEVVKMTHFDFFGDMLLRYQDVALYENRTAIVDPSFLSMFSFPLYEGNPETCLNDPNSIIISRQLANKLFGTDRGLIGKMITIDNKYAMRVNGLLENVPTNSSLRFNALVPYEFSKAIGMTDDKWGNNNIPTYLQLSPSANANEVAEKISALDFAHTSENADISTLPTTAKGTPNWRTRYELRSVSDMYLTGYFGYGQPNGRLRYVYIMSIIGIVILLLACVNFVNLTISKANQKAAEVGLRKSIGAMRSQLAVQLFGETMMYVFIAAVGAIILVELLIPYFNAWSGKIISGNLFTDIRIIGGLIGLVIFTSLVAGSYPAFILSSFRPRAFLGNELDSSPLGRMLRRITVTFQFAISLVLLIVTGVVYHQTEFMNSQDIGYDTDNLISIEMRGDMPSNYNTFRRQLLTDPQILAVSGSLQHPSFNGANTGGVNWPGKTEDEKTLIGINIVDFDFTKTMGIQLLEGHSFNENSLNDSVLPCIINEEFAKILTKGNGSALGAILEYGNQKGEVIGIAKSFKRTAVTRPTEPTILFCSNTNLKYAFVKLRDNSPASMAALNNAFSTAFPDYPFDYKYYSDEINNFYRPQEQLSMILMISAAIAILIACLGMFGMASISAERRLKEIAIRKVLGATDRKLFSLFSKEYIIIILTANLIGIPVAHYFSKLWLEDFPYRIGIDPALYIYAAIISTITAGMAISYHVIRAVGESPVKILKTQG